MSRTRPPATALGQRSGCLRSPVGLLALVTMAPPAAIWKWWQRRRRGADVRCHIWSGHDVGGGALLCHELAIDAPSGRESGVQRALTDSLVRVAEELRQPDDVYHLLTREAGEDATGVAVGARVQALGERFALALTRSALAERTQVWLTLPANLHLSQAVDLERCDPDGDREPDAIVASARARWAVATSFAPRGPSSLFRLRFYLPPATKERAGVILSQLERALTASDRPPS